MTTRAPHKPDYQQLEDTIRDAMMSIGKGYGKDQSVMGDEYNAILDGLAEFVSFMESMHARSVAALAGAVSSVEAKHPTIAGATRDLLDSSVGSYEEVLRTQVNHLVKHGMPFDPYGEKTHNERLAESILAEMGSKGSSGNPAGDSKS